MTAVQDIGGKKKDCNADGGKIPPLRPARVPAMTAQLAAPGAGYDSGGLRFRRPGPNSTVDGCRISAGRSAGYDSGGLRLRRPDPDPGRSTGRC